MNVMYTDDSFGLSVKINLCHSKSEDFPLSYLGFSPGGVFKIGFDWTQVGSISCKTMSGFISG